jgi:hypothetical protein
MTIAVFVKVVKPTGPAMLMDYATAGIGQRPKYHLRRPHGHIILVLGYKLVPKIYVLNY